MHAGGSGVKLDDGPDLKIFINKGPNHLVCCLAGLDPYLESLLVLNFNLECGLQ